jgi:DNA repair protein RadC
MNAYGYTAEELLPLSQQKALELWDADRTIYLLYPDNTEAMAFEREEIEKFDGLFGIEREEWQAVLDIEAVKEVVRNSEGSREADLLYSNTSKFGIYQIRDDIDESRNFRFAPMKELEALGPGVDRSNYKLVYTGALDIRDTLTNLHKIFQDFNTNQPSDYTGCSVSVSDVIVLQWRGDVSAYYVDSAGFQKLDNHAFFGEEPNRQAAKSTPEQTNTALANNAQTDS